MQDITNIRTELSERFKNALENKSEKDFYQLLYYYFDYIEKTPILHKIFWDSYNDYSQKHFEIWRIKSKTDREVDDKSAKTNKLEQFNLYAVGSWIYNRIYIPIDDYKNSPEPDREQDPVAVILMRGESYALSLNEFPKIKYTNRWSKDSIRSYSRWFKDKRNFYEPQLRKFHAILLDELQKVKESKQIQTTITEKKQIKRKIIIDDKKGIYRDDNPELNYKIKKDSKRFQIINFLIAKDKTAISEMEKEVKQEPTLIIKEIKKINELFRTQLKVSDDLVIHYPTGGYALNKDEFEIRINS